MKNTIVVIITGIIAALAIATPAEASGSAWYSEAKVRKANGIPSSVVYIKGTAGWVRNDIRCFEAKATKRSYIKGQPVRVRSIVTYCTHGYVDRTKGSDYARRVILSPGW